MTSFRKYLKRRTWIDWIKFFVAIDIASAGFGLIVNLNIHLVAPIFGFITRIFMGLMYITLSLVILRKVFPKDEFYEEHVEEKQGIKGRAGKIGKKVISPIFLSIQRIGREFTHLTDLILDRLIFFFKQRFSEVRNEIKREVHDD